MKSTSFRNRLLLLFSSFIVLAIIGCIFFLQNTGRISHQSKEINSLLTINANRLDSVRVSATEDRAGKKNIETALNSISRSSETLRWGFVIFFLIISLLFLLGGFWVIKNFKRSLNEPMLVLDGLVKGDTSILIEPKKDEFAVVTDAANELSKNLKQSSDFAKMIGEGNFDFEFKPLSDKDVLGNSLVQMREKLKDIAEEDRKRNWTSEGLAKFADIIRKGEDQKKLLDTLIRELVVYTKSNQGGIFVAQRENGTTKCLELVSCYAFERKKYLTKRIELGEGLLGQCFLEEEPIYLLEVPPNFAMITSGLGKSNPNSLLLIPMKLNETIEGVIEIASFKEFEEYQIVFVQKVGEIIASAISALRIAERTNKMLQESQLHSEQLRAQEEEMRQNMEEMQATQEAMERQTAELRQIQTTLEIEKSMFNVLMEFLPDRITYKDKESRIMRINKAKAERLKMRPEEVVGKTDYDFFSKEHAEKAMQEEKALLYSGKPLMDIEEKLVFTSGDIAWVSTSRIPFKNEHNETTGMFIITKDITKFKLADFALKDREAMIQRLIHELPVLSYSVNAEKKIDNVRLGSSFPKVLEPKQLISGNLKDVFPQVNSTIDAWGEQQEQVCSENINALTLRNYIFPDSVHIGSYCVLAVVDK
jgi:methyl-accepting chemotaxis protein